LTLVVACAMVAGGRGSPRQEERMAGATQVLARARALAKQYDVRGDNAVQVLRGLLSVEFTPAQLAGVTTMQLVGAIGGRPRGRPRGTGRAQAQAQQLVRIEPEPEPDPDVVHVAITSPETSQRRTALSMALWLQEQGYITGSLCREVVLSIFHSAEEVPTSIVRMHHGNGEGQDQ
jgi:hypothetical protein